MFDDKENQIKNVYVFIFKLVWACSWYNTKTIQLLLDNVNKKLFDIEKLVTDREKKSLSRPTRMSSFANWLNKQMTPGSGAKSGGVAGVTTKPVEEREV